MFTAHFSIGSLRRAGGLWCPAGQVLRDHPTAGRILRTVAVCGLLAVALPGIASAQAIGTMQVAARVVPASAAWAGVSEAGLAAQAAAAGPTNGPPLIRRTGLVRSATVVRAVGDRRVVVVTIQHPHN